MKNNKKAFSLIELIFIIVVLGIIASVALPKLMDTRSDAKVSTIKQDVSTVVNSVQTYYLTNGTISKVSDAVNLNSSVWDITDTEIKFLEDGNTCVSIKINGSKLDVTVDSTAGTICEKLSDSGVVTTSYDLK